MAFFGDQNRLQFTAAADFTGKKYHVVRLSAANATNIASLGTSSEVIGVIQNVPKATEQATVCTNGLTKVVAGAAVTVGAYLTHNSSGRAITVVSGNMCIGRILDTATADGDVVSMIAMTPFRWSGAA